MGERREGGGENRNVSQMLLAMRMENGKQEEARQSSRQHPTVRPTEKGRMQGTRGSSLSSPTQTNPRRGGGMARRWRAREYWIAATQGHVFGIERSSRLVPRGHGKRGAHAVIDADAYRTIIGGKLRKRIEAIERVEEKGVESIGEVYDMPLNKRHKMAKGVARACKIPPTPVRPTSIQSLGDNVLAVQYRHGHEEAAG
ncbi:hypothetical protein CPB86DRAFT_800526 [Serendipita vermifera]|nr:hypothetical protein CPB86DRAFT_800526 [Serendipita vermifera]